VKNTVDLHGIETKKVHVGDIDIAYKMFGKGNPILLINGFSAPLDFWDPMLLEKLASKVLKSWHYSIQTRSENLLSTHQLEEEMKLDRLVRKP
jgi:hypothetical protein